MNIVIDKPSVSENKFFSFLLIIMPVLGKRKSLGARKAPYKKRRTSRKSVTQMVKSIVQNASETKLFTPALVQTTIGTTPLVDELTDIAQGDGEGERVGNKVTARFVKIMGDVNLNPLSTYSIVRICVIQWFPSSVPTAALLFETGARADLALWNKDQAEHFRVLYDRRISLTDVGNNRAVTFAIKAFPKKYNKVISYDGDALTTGGSHIYFVACGSDDTNKAGIEYQAGFYYTD